jgi:cardiolipin synthase
LLIIQLCIFQRENVWTVPNILCVGRIIASPYLGYLIIQGNFPLAIAVFAFAGVTDMVSFCMT